MMELMSERRATWRAVFFVGTGIAVAGLVVIAVFLAPKSPAEANNWAGVIGVFLAYAALFAAPIVWIYRRAFPARVAAQSSSDSSSSGPAVDGKPFGYQGGAVMRPAEPVHELPAGVPEFIGRHKQIAAASAALTSEKGPRVVNVHGLPGAGKTEFAIYLARQESMAKDTQLFIDLRGSKVEEALGSALLSLGAIAAELPAGLAARAAQFRSLLWRRTATIVIDNATADPQVRHLLPGDGHSGTIVASLIPLGDISGAILVALPPLSDDEAVEFLQNASGRFDESSESGARRVARLVGRLPLALQICAGLLKANQDWKWDDLAGRLVNPDGIVETHNLTTGTLTLRASLDLAYTDLGPALAEAYRQLGRLPRPEASETLVRSLFNPDHATSIIDRLVERQLLQRASGGYHMHNLIWAHTRQLVAEVPADEREAVEHRLIDWTLQELHNTYLPRLAQSVRPVLLIGGARNRAIDLPKVYVDAPLRIDGLLARVSDVLMTRRRLVVVGSGGSGKTTMVSWLCLAAANNPDRSEVPLLIYARDIDPDERFVDVGSLLTRSLRVRFGVDVVPGVLSQAITQGGASLVVDGLDEVPSDARSRFGAAIDNFATQHPHTSILITTRPFKGLDAELPGFERAELGTWSSALIDQYAANLSAAAGLEQPTSKGDLARVLQETGKYTTFGTPLLQQMLFGYLSTYRVGPSPDIRKLDVTSVVGSIIGGLLLDRELLRIRNAVGAERLRSVLERLAYVIQITSADRVTITETHARAALVSFESADLTLDALMYAIDQLASREVLLSRLRAEGEEVRYAFVHSLYQEYLASTYAPQT
jgi:hypothetical protein